MSNETAAPTGTITLVFSDIQGSTILWEHFGEKFQEILEIHNRLIREAIAAFNGYEVKTEGDAFMVAFQDALEAVEFSLDVQLKLQDADWPTALLSTPTIKELSGISEDGHFRGLRIRIGIHSGKPSHQIDPTTGRTDYFGPMVNRSARVSGIGHGGQVILSGATWQLVQDRLGDSVVTDLGEHSLKGLERRETIRQVMPHRLAGRTFADLSTKHSNPTNLQAELDSFVGREDDLEQLKTVLDDNARLINILGPGGTGKTRIAQRFGHRYLDSYPGGVWFCDLTEARTVDGICAVTAGAIDISLTQQDSVVQLGQELRNRGRVLCILDNFEQVVDFAATTIRAWLKNAPNLSIIVTSRERLKIEGEHVYSLDPLPPQAAIQLFEERAKLVRPDFSVNDQNREAVAEIVERLDRMSLAIELAAARVRILPPKKLLERLSKRFSLLRQGRSSSSGSTRQETLEGAIRWSWELLAPPEQMALAQCSIFRGGFTLEAAEDIIDLAPWPDAPWSLDILEALQDKSLLQLREVLPGHDRFFMYESIRVFATDRLSEPGAICSADEVSQSGEHALQAVTHRVASFYARCGTQEYLQSLTLHGGDERLRELALDLDNLLTSLHRSLSTGHAELATRCFFAATHVLNLKGPCLLVSQLADLLLSCPTLNLDHLAQIQFEKGRAFRLVGQIDEARETLEKARTTASESQNRRILGRALGELAIVSEFDGHMDEALANYEEALAIHREVDNQYQEGIVLSNMGILHRIQGRPKESRRHYEEALTIHRRIGNRRAEGIALCNLANLFSQAGQTEEAMQRLQESLFIFRETGDRRDETLVLGNLGDLFLQLNDLPKAREHLETAIGASKELGLKRAEGAFLGAVGEVYYRQGDIPEARSHLNAGEIILREVEDKIELGLLLCRLGQLQLDQGEIQEAIEHHQEAQKLAQLVSAGNESALGRALSTFEQAINDA